VATACLLDRGEVPRAVIVTGAVMGLTFALVYPWPLPGRPLSEADYRQPGFMPWPVWAPLPDWLPGSLALGLASGAAGILGPAWLVRLVGRGERTTEDLLVMTGGFLGWQPLLVALAVAGVLALVPARRLPFALLVIPALVAVWLGWAWVGPPLRPFLFDPVVLPVCLAGVAVLVAWVTRAKPAPPAGD
jgi:hypothetical protein